MEPVVKYVKLVDGLLSYNSTEKQTFSAVVQKIDEKTSAHTVVSSDVGMYLRINSSEAVNVTIGDFECEIGACVTFEQSGAGVITLVASGVTLNALDDGLSSMGQFSVIQIIKVDELTFTVVGGTV